MTDLAARLRMTDRAAWPDPVAQIALQRPALSIPVAPVGAGYRATGPMPDTAPTDLMPKLGPKSWQETGRLRVIPEGQPLAPAVAVRLASPTRAQMAVLGAGWADPDGDPAFLHLFPRIDFAGITECRCLWTAGRFSLLSVCRRSAVALDEAEAKRHCATIAEALPGLGPFVAQFAQPLGRPLSLIDLNPGLGQKDLAALTPAA